MKKIFFTIVSSLFIITSSAKAETIIVIDENGYVKQQIVTSDPIQYTNQQQVTVVRENPTVQNSYYYDAPSTGGAILAGVTTAVVGALLYNEFKPNNHHKHKPAPIKIHSKHKPAPIKAHNKHKPKKH